MLNAGQSRKYFETRFGGQLRGSGPNFNLKCPFHDDRKPSFSLHLEKGLWKCHTGCGEGGLIDFEMRLSNCDRDAAMTRINEIVGEQVFGGAGEKPEAIYPYHDADGKLLFEKLRYPGKRFVCRRPNGNGGWVYNLDGIKKPLYQLPKVITANYAIICEGEKDADNLQAAVSRMTLPEHCRLAITTNFGGAEEWRDEYAPFFAGKKVVVLPDNDEAGRKRGERVAASLAKYASGVKLVQLPGLPEKGDVSDYLEKHSGEELFEEIKKAPQWRPQTATQKLFITAPAFVGQVPGQTDWLVEGIIERGANGFIAAAPKGGKSWAAADMAISLALGCEWLGFRVPRPVKVALVSREDNPSLTGWRIKHLSAGKTCTCPSLLETNLYVNSRKQSPELMLDNPEQLAELLEALKTLQVEFSIFDVFNVMHVADENDAQEMRAVLRQLSRVQSEVGCDCCVVHHWNKVDQGSMTQRLRGSSAIAGWAEWLIGISMTDAETKTRRMEFELKAAQPPDAIYYRIETNGEVSRLERVLFTAPQSSRAGSAARLMQ